MKMKKKRIVCLILCLFLFAYEWTARAESAPLFSFGVDSAQAERNGAVRVTLSAGKRGSDSSNPAGFRAALEYDPERLALQRIEVSDRVQDGAFQYYDNGQQITGVYVCDGISAPRLSGAILTFVFSVHADAPAGKGQISAAVDQVVDWAGHFSDDDATEQELDFRVSPPLSQDALLSSLIPSVGALQPPFSPEVAEYAMDVPADVSKVEFQADAKDGGSVRVSRKSLLGAGQATEIVVTVTAEDKKSKSQYLITVNRAGREEEASSEEASRAAALKASSASSRRSSARAPSSARPRASGGNAAPPGSAPPQSAAAYGERNLYIAGGQLPEAPLWIIAGCVCVLTLLTAAGIFRNKK